MGGWNGKILSIDLSSGKVEVVSIPFDRDFIGGRGLGAHLLYQRLSPGIDPLSADNQLIVLTGPLTGTIAPVGSKYVVVTKSPATGAFLDSYASGKIATQIKFAGYDGIIVVGKARAPSYVYIENDIAQVKDAGDLWGKDTHEAETILTERHGETAGVMVIGRAGENLSALASINSDYYRQAGRGGPGAVMGSKNLKAIVVKGSKPFDIGEGPRLIENLKTDIERISKSVTGQARVRYGTPLTLNITNSIGMLPTRNFQSGTFPKANGRIDAEAVATYTIRSRGCYGCPIACGKITKVTEGPFSGDICEGPEYETLGLLGSNLGVSYLPAIIHMNILCDKLGLDTISTGNVIGFAMECFEKGLITTEETGGLDLRFGNYEAAIETIAQIASGKKIGKLLSNGVKAAAEEIGKGSRDFAIHSKGLEFPAYEPRAGFGTALAYAVCPRGACHRRAWPPAIEALGGHPPFTSEGKGRLVKRLYDENNVFHSLLVCDFPGKFIPLGVGDYAGYLAHVTGHEFSENDLLDAADRIETQIRLFNVREGFTREDDALPHRIINEPLSAGPAAGKVIGQQNLDSMLDQYYELRGWDRSGKPLTETLEKWGLENA